MASTTIALERFKMTKFISKWVRYVYDRVNLDILAIER